MVSPVTNTPYSYYNVLNPNKPLKNPTANPPAPVAPATPPKPAGDVGNVGLSPAVVTALQNLIDNGGNTSTLFNSKSKALSALPEGNILEKAFATALKSATQAKPNIVPGQDQGSKTVQNALAAYQKAVQAAHPNPKPSGTSA